MHRAYLAALAAALATAVVFVGPAPGHGDDFEAKYVRAHAAAVKYRAQRDHVQELLAHRVRENRALRRALVNNPSSLEALRLAAVVYDVDFRLLYRISSCESTGTDPDHSPVSERSLAARAKNGHSTARGLGQFLDSTWASTPFAAFDVNSPYANALAIGNEISHGNQNWQWAASRRCWS